MTRDDRAGEAAEEAIATVRELLLGEDDGHASATFVRGLTLGALIGAAIAGSAIWHRRQRRGAAGDRADRQR